MSIRIMKAFQIETNYQRHKQKISSIGNLNVKKRVMSSTDKNAAVINNYKKRKQTADMFKQREIKIERQLVNDQMRKSIMKVQTRENKTITNNNKNHSHSNFCRVSSRSSLRSSTSDYSKIRTENKIMGKKLSNATSSYAKYRQNSSRKNNKNQNYKDQLIRLLEAQLGAKPQVVFPKMKQTKYQDNRKSKQSSTACNKRRHSFNFNNARHHMIETAK